MIKTKRVYEQALPEDGMRILVDRLWPRGIRKTDLHLDQWLKDVAPSTELRLWFHHEQDRWDEFCSRYFSELDQNPAAWKAILTAARRGTVTLLYSTHDVQHNNAVALEEFLRKQQKTND